MPPRVEIDCAYGREERREVEYDARPAQTGKSRQA
jgi:hypothetical protein